MLSQKGGGGRYYWMLIGWNRGQFIFWITKALLVIKRAWLLDWVFLLFAATIYWLQFDTMKQCNTINCIPPHMRDYNLPAVLSRSAFISTSQKKKNAVTCMIRPNEARKDCRVCWRPKCNNCPKWNKVLNVINFWSWSAFSLCLRLPIWCQKHISIRFCSQCFSIYVLSK